MSNTERINIRAGHAGAGKPGVGGRLFIRRGRWLLPLVIGLAGLAAACSKGDAHNAAGPGGKPGAGGGAMGAMGAVPVLVAHATTQNVPVDLKCIGSVEASSTVDVKSMIAGQILKVHFQRGQEVKAGDVLYSIDARPYEAALAQAKASLDADTAQIAKAQADVARDQVQLKNSEREEQRLKDLLGHKVVSQDEYDTQHTQTESLRATVQSDEAAVQVARESVGAAKAAVEKANVDLSYCTIRAPISGRTGDVLIHEGSWVKANDAAMVVINRLQPVLVSFSVPEQYLQQVRTAMAEREIPVRAYPPNQSDTSSDPAVGKLTFINNAVDPQTGTVTMMGTFPNPGERLWPGQFVDAHLTLRELSGAVVVPSQAIETGQNGDFVFVVGADNTVRVQPVTAGVTVGGMTVVQSGLKAGDEVVTDGQMRLNDGAHIQVKTTVGGGAPQPANAD